MRRGQWAVALALVALTVAAYTPVWRFDFIAVDDPQYVSENPHVTAGVTASGVAWAFTTGHESNWHPLTWISHQLDVTIAGVDPGAHHLVNLVLHVLNTLLLLAVLRRLTGDFWPSVFVAAVFAVHPLHVESVAWIAERKDVLSAMFFILAIGAWERYVRTQRRSAYVAVAALFALGLMAKPMVVTLPLVLLLLDWWPLGRRESIRARVLEKLPLVAIAAASAVVTFVVQQRGGSVGSIEAFPFPLRVANAAVSLFDYLVDVVWPDGLGMFYPFPASISVSRWVSAAMVLGAITAVTIALRRRAPAALMGWLWWLVMLVPVIGLVQVGAQSRADRYTYLPLIGLTIAVAWGVGELTARASRGLASIAAAAAAIAIGALAVTTHAQVAHWRDAVSIATRTAVVTDDTNNFGVHYGLAEYLRAHGRLSEAIPHYEESIRKNPGFVEAQTGLAATQHAAGLQLAQIGRIGEAIPHFQAAARLAPQRAEARRDLAAALAAEGRFAEAAPEFSEALRLGLESADLRYQHGLVLAAIGRMDEAIAQLAAAVRLAPDHVDAHMTLARAYARAGRPDDSVRELREVLRIDPSHAQARAALAASGR